MLTSTVAKKLAIAAIGSVAIALGTLSKAQAASFTLFYDVRSEASQFLYDFNLVQTQAVSPGTSLNWIIFFDQPWLAPYTSPQPVSDIHNPQLVGPAPGPFTSLNTSTGGHNGPTFVNFGDSSGWYTQGIGDRLNWQILADNLVTDIQWTNLWGTGDSENYVMHDAVAGSASIPEPMTILGTLIGCGALAVARSRSKHAQ